MKVRTLKTQLLKNLFFPIIALLLIIAGIVCWSAHDEIYEVYDSQLITATNVLWLVNRGSADKESSITVPPKDIDVDLGGTDQASLDEYGKWRSFRIWKNDKLIIASDNARPDSIPPAIKGFSNIKMSDGSSWRVFALYVPEEKVIVEVSEDLAARYNFIGNVLEGVLWPLLFALPVFAFLIWRGLNNGLQDLRRFANDIKKRTPNDLSHLDETNVFEELLPISEGINQLLCKLEKSLSYERLFTDNATHELRTPLAALQLQTDVLLHSENESERKEALLELVKSSKRTSRLLGQLLTLAQLREEKTGLKPVNIYSITSDVIKSSYANALKKNIQIELSGNEKLEAMAHDELLFTLVSNLVDNAIKYSPEGGKVNISIGLCDGKPIFIITDTGAGIPVAEHENVFHRFYRLPGNPQTGSGLGLAIVKQICEILNINIELFSPEDENGLGVKLIFPDNNGLYEI